MSDHQAVSLANDIYLAYVQGQVAVVDMHWALTPEYLRPQVTAALHLRIAQLDNAHVFGHCIGWHSMARWLRDRPSSIVDVVQQCPRIMTAWWKNTGCAVWTSWAHQSLGSLLWMDACQYLAAGNWHVWGSDQDHIVAHLSHYYENHPNALSPNQQKALRAQLDAFALTNARFMQWLRAQAFYDSSWEDALFMQTHNHHRHACAFDARLLNPHSRAVAYYVHQLRSQEQTAFSDGYWFFPALEDTDSAFARVLIDTCPDIAFHCNTVVDPCATKYMDLRDSLALHQRIDPDLSMLVQWLHGTPVASWGQPQESTVGPW